MRGARDILLEVVAAKTGYPIEMLNLDMSLDLDLGIDSIKRVEILSALQERLPEMPAIKAEELGTLQTLRQIVALMTVTAVDTAKAKAPTETDRSPSLHDDVQIKRGIVTVMPLTEKEKRGQILLPDQAIIWVSDEGTELTQAVCRALRARGLAPEVVVMGTVPDNKPSGLLLLSPTAPRDDYLYEAFQWLQRAGTHLRRTGKEKQAILVSASRLGGRFGIGDIGDANPISGGLAGLVKSADKEWPGVVCKALDLPLTGDSTELAAFIVEEALLQGPLETGLGEDGPCIVTIESQPLDEDVSSLSKVIAPGDLVVVSGGARGVTASVAVALSRTCQASLLLLGRSPEPVAEADWLQGLTTEADIKKALLAHSADGTRPGELEKNYRKIMANREILANLRRIESGGGRAVYRSVDVRDADAVAEMINEARQSLGPVRGLVHAAGVLADRLIEDKTAEQFAADYATRAEGLN